MCSVDVKGSLFKTYCFTIYCSAMWFDTTKYATKKLNVAYIGYEPAGLTVHPPPQNDRGWIHFFRMGV